LYGHEEINFIEKRKKNNDNDEEEQQLIDRMTATVGAAVPQMEPHIKAGTLWCPSAEGNIKTPNQKTSASSTQQRML
jgi:hypothetical protein